MKRSILASLALGSLLLSACGQANPLATGDGASFSSAVSAASSVQGEARVIRIEASNWKFTPSTINAKVGEKVQIEMVNVSGMHGIAVPELGIDVKADEGQTVTVDLPTDKAGTFPFKCNVFCGEGHREMTGTIVIE